MAEKINDFIGKFVNEFNMIHVYTAIAFGMGSQYIMLIKNFDLEVVKADNSQVPLSLPAILYPIAIIMLCIAKPKVHGYSMP